MSLSTDSTPASDVVQPDLPSEKPIVSAPPKSGSHWKRRFMNEKDNNPTVLGHIVLSTSLIVIVILSYAGMFWFAGTKQNEWLGSNQTLSTEEINRAIATLPATPPQKARLVDQFQQIQTRIEKHANIMSFFYRQYFISLSMILSASVIATLCLFFISKQGWERVNNALINVFIVSTSVVLFYGNASLVFKQEENIRDNQISYLNYFALRNELLSYWATQQIVTGDTIPADQFIHYMDKRLQELSQIPLGFDSTRFSNIGDQLQQLTESAEQ